MKTGVHGDPLSVPTPGPDDVLIEVGERDGGFSEYVTVPFDNAHAIETSLSDAELATFPTAYVTVERMLNRVRLGAGETIFVTGASSGVGSALVQLAKWLEARVVALTGPGKASHLRDLEAELVLTRDRDDWPKRLRDELGSERSTSLPTWSAAVSSAI